ncbi:uncharacterized protein LOC143447112 [Clavelina lepadiformis]|uniref:uncharacterized protein LOC143447112 n=1 Tax=Clavelina lepadiformis TaxID=159417 RepID=UPI004042644B
MRVDKSIPTDKRTGVSVYYDDYKQRLPVDCSGLRPSSAFRRNNPHPSPKFLDPCKIPDESTRLENKVRHAVRKYLDDVYQTSRQINSDGSYQSPPVFQLTADTVRERILTRPKSTPSFKLSPDCTRDSFGPTNSIRINGQGIRRPGSAILLEKSPLAQLDGETKRERSVRIDETIKEDTRLRTPKPQREIWQKTQKSPIPPQNKPHWVTNSDKTSKKRISSAPPGSNGFTYYPQQVKRKMSMDKDDHMPLRLDQWAKNASNYEKNVVFSMLKKVTPDSEPFPTTPASGEVLRISGVPAADYHYPGVANGHAATDPNMRHVKESWNKRGRKVHSAPVKKMGGLVPASTQRPLNDKRVYRLKGQDSRLNPSPGEERELNQYMDKMELHTVTSSSADRRPVKVPMYTYLPRSKGHAQDYQCKVSFFQTVRSPFKKHFIIHPDFTSENVKKRKPVSHNITHFRY